MPGLLDAIKNGHDVHAATAALLYGVDLDTLLEKVHSGDKEASALRASAKTVNFALLYGVGVSHLAEILGCSQTEASGVKARYFAAIPEAQQFINMVYNVIKARGYVRNYFGRRRRLKTDECYKAPNALIQGCAADYIKFKIVDMYKFLNYNGLNTKLINVVHDEVVISLDNSELEYAPQLRWLMSDFTTFRCPITAGAEFGQPSWGQKFEPDDIGFVEPTDKGYKTYNVYDGAVFDIYR